MNAVRTGLAIVGAFTVIRAMSRFVVRAHETRLEMEQLKDELADIAEAYTDLLRKDVRKANGDGG